MTHKIRYDTGSDAGSMKVSPTPPAYAPLPTWQPFPGFSFIFNNRGEALETRGPFQLMHIADPHLEEIELYARIRQAVETIDPTALAQRFLFFVLPPSTYHVTVWDGINKGNEDRLDPDSTTRFRASFSQGLEDVIRKWPPFGEHHDYTKWFDDVGPIRLRYRGLRARASTVLVVELETDPNDSASCAVLDEIHRRREKLDEYFADAFGKPRNYNLRPHVAIGYFANSDLGDSALYRHMDTWMYEFDRLVGGSSIEFNDISLYAFSDMVTYVKPI